MSAFDSMEPPDRSKTSLSRSLGRERMGRETGGGERGGRGRGSFRESRMKSERDDQKTASDDVFSSDLRSELNSLISKLNYDRNRIGSTMVFCLDNVKHSESVCFLPFFPSFIPHFIVSHLMFDSSVRRVRKKTDSKQTKDLQRFTR